MMGDGQQQLQQLSQELQALEAEIETQQSLVEDLQAEQVEIDEAVEAIGTLNSGDTVQVPLGGGAYVRAEVQDIDEVVVSLGGGYAAEQAEEDAVAALERKREALDDRIAEVKAEIAGLEDESDQLEQQAQQMQQQLQQQQMQQMQQPDEDAE